MILYMVPLAPNPTKVMLYIAEREALGVQFGIEQVVINTLKGRHKTPEHLARNPFGLLPVLEFDEGQCLIESLTIMQYLEDIFPENRLLPADPLARARALELERIVEIKIAAPMGRYVHATKSPIGKPANPAAAAEAEETLQPPLDYLEAKLADGRPYLTGDAISLADFTLAAFHQFLRFIEADLMGDRPNLRAWDARFRARPAAASVLKW